MLVPLDNRQKRHLKSLAQKLDATVHLGKAGITEGFVASLNTELDRHELIKLRFDQHKEEKHELAPQIAAKANCHFVWMIGHVAVFFRQQADPEKRKIVLPGPRAE